MTKTYDDEDGVWRTIGGRRVFIRNGQSLSDAMKESGKFGGSKAKKEEPAKETKKEEPKKDDTKKDEIDTRYDDNYRGNDYWDLSDAYENGDYDDKELENELKNMYKSQEGAAKAYKEITGKEMAQKEEKDYEKYKEMRLDDPSKYNDDQIKEFNELDKKYLDRFGKEPTKVVKYRDEYAVIENGGIQKTFDNVDDAKKFESELKSKANNENKRTTKDDAYRQAAKELGYKRHTSDEKESREIYERAQEIIKDHPEITEYENMKENAYKQAAKELGYKRHTSDEKENREIYDRAQEIMGKNANNRYEEIDSKSVIDSDGFNTGKEKELTSEDWELINKQPRRKFKEGEEISSDEWGKILDQEQKNRAELKQAQANREKATNDDINNSIREKASKKTKGEPNLPKKTEIKEQGTSNRKEVSENIQAHILDYYDDPQDFVEQMEYMHEPNMWRAGEELASGGSYAIYTGDQREFLDSLKINPSGKEFSDDKVFNTYKSLIGRESAKLYDRLKRNAYNEYKREHPLSKMTFDEFKEQSKK